MVDGDAELKRKAGGVLAEVISQTKEYPTVMVSISVSKVQGRQLTLPAEEIGHLLDNSRSIDRLRLKVFHNIEEFIIDFGLCNHTKDGTTLFTGCGSPNYAAPEILMQCGYDGT